MAVGLVFRFFIWSLEAAVFVVCWKYHSSFTRKLQIHSVATGGCRSAHGCEVSIWIGQKNRLHRKRLRGSTFPPNNPHTDDSNGTLNSNVYSNKLLFHHTNRDRSCRNAALAPQINPLLNQL